MAMCHCSRGEWCEKCRPFSPIKDYEDGFLDGLAAFAWMKDGVTYVGSCGTTLAQAVEMFQAGKIWNQRKSNVRDVR